MFLLRAFHIVKAFIELGNRNTVESLQALYVAILIYLRCLAFDTTPY